MAGNETQKQLLTLIRDYSTEKSQTERRIANQKKRIEELRSDLETASSELEEAKRVKETTEQEIKGYEVESSINESSIQALEARIAATNNEISKVGAELEALKTEEYLLRDGFIEKMLELNAQIRKFRELLDTTFNADNFGADTLTGGVFSRHDQDAQKAAVVLENKLAEITLQTSHEEQQLNSQQLIHDQVQQELINLEKKALLLDSVVKESMELQELSRYPWILCCSFKISAPLNEDITTLGLSLIKLLKEDNLGQIVFKRDREIFMHNFVDTESLY